MSVLSETQNVCKRKTTLSTPPCVADLTKEEKNENTDLERDMQV